jgi:hypothetical protein
MDGVLHKNKTKLLTCLRIRHGEHEPDNRSLKIYSISSKIEVILTSQEVILFKLWPIIYKRILSSFASLKSYGWKYCSLICCERKTLPACARIKKALPACAWVSCAHAGPTPPDHAWGLLMSPPLLARISTCVTPDLLLKHLDATLETCF